MRQFRITALLALALSMGAQPVLAQRLSLTLGHGERRGAVHLELGRRSHGCAPARTWVAGRYEVRIERVWIEGCERQVWIPPRYEVIRDGCGRELRIQVCAGEWRVVRDPGRYENREVRVWVPGHWREAPRY